VEYTPRVLNNFLSVRAAVDKANALEIFKREGVPCPDFTTDKERANEWMENGETVVARELTRGSGGRGITICSSGDDLPDAPLYTKYVKKRDEFRVFVVNGKIVRVAQKRCRRGFDAESTNFRVRNHTGGWVFCTDEVARHACVDQAAKDAVRVLALDFGAVDVGYNAHHDAACVYEVNTAFGVEGDTARVIANAIREEFLT
jgi:glutathione synthase/RimK-type ligase-like ATP-grasp enzyme